MATLPAVAVVPLLVWTLTATQAAILTIAGVDPAKPFPAGLTATSPVATSCTPPPLPANSYRGVYVSYSCWGLCCWG